MSTDYFNPPNSVWPNGLKRDEEGYVNFYPIGTNKVDITTITWPEGDKLVSPFVYQDDKLVGFIDTKALTIDSQTTIYLPYTYIEANFSAINKGQLQIYAPKATTKKVTWKNSGEEDIPEIQFKYKGCTTVDNVKTVDANYQTTDIVDGVWSEPLWDLTDGIYMFRFCTNLTSFNTDLFSLKSGRNMFYNCSNLTTFTSDLSSLTNGLSMFYNCSNLTTFTSDLVKLGGGSGMFSNCKLDASSVKNIIDTIKTILSTNKPIITLGMGCNDTTEDKDLFAQEIGYVDMTSLRNALVAKGWSVTAQYNGRPTTTYGLRRTSEDTLPVFAKLEETEEHADYTSEDGSKKFILDWFHETTGSTEGYTQYATLEEAIEALNIKPIERN